jgi:hypothetical protein
MVEAIEELKNRGFTANFEFLDQTFREVDSGRTFKADELTIVGHYQFGGASNPDDMSVVYAIEGDDGLNGAGHRSSAVPKWFFRSLLAQVDVLRGILRILFWVHPMGPLRNKYCRWV